MLLPEVEPDVLLWASFSLCSLLAAYQRVSGKWALIATFAALISHASLRRTSPLPAVLALASGLSLLVGRMRARKMPNAPTGSAPALLALLMLCAGWNSLQDTALRTSHPPRGQFVYLDAAHRLHVICTDGAAESPLVLLDAGLPCTSASWRLVEKAAAAQGNYTVCAFDRAGYGWSDKREGQRDAATLADEAAGLLIALLADRASKKGRRTSVDERAIIVGWSFGGYTSMVLAKRHPTLVSGLVLVDSSLPQQTSISGFSDLLLTGQVSFALMRLLLPLGACRLAEKASLLPRDAGAPPPDLEREAKAEISAHVCWPGFAAAAAAELNAWRVSEAQLDDALPALNHFPLAVIAANKEGGILNIDAQRELAAYGNPTTTVFSVADSDHDIPFHAPQSVIHALNQLSGLIRNAG